jgi:hypothetical protein
VLLAANLLKCRITAMDKLALFDESDGLSEEQKLKLFKTWATHCEAQKP